ncbi:MAG: hypothetical protein DCF20_20075 [Pseudanabaena sp.]|nr:MAG: hypothetical protein DCF20_20075 [Pseudanabaena sp.]
MRFYYRVALIALFVAGIFTAQVVNAQTQPTSILIENVRIFDGKSAQLSAPSNLLVVGNKIETISTNAIATPTGEKVTRLNGGGRVLMPGLLMRGFTSVRDVGGLTSLYHGGLCQ